MHLPCSTLRDPAFLVSAHGVKARVALARANPATEETPQDGARRGCALPRNGAQDPAGGGVSASPCPAPSLRDDGPHGAKGATRHVRVTPPSGQSARASSPVRRWRE